MKTLFAKKTAQPFETLVKNFIQLLELNDPQIEKSLYNSTIAFNSPEQPQKTIQQFGRMNLLIQKGKKHSYTGMSIDNVKYQPAIFVNEYDKDGNFVEAQLCTAPMIFSEPENYDDNCFWMLIQNLSNERWSKTDKRLEFIDEAVDILQTREKERQKQRDTNKELGLEVKTNSSYENEEEFYWGKKKAKSFYGLPYIPNID